MALSLQEGCYERVWISVAVISVLVVLSCTSVSCQSPPPGNGIDASLEVAISMDEAAESESIKRALSRQGNQETTSALLFNTSGVGLILAEQSAATLLAPDDSAWVNLPNQEGGSELQELLMGSQGSTVLSNLLKFHIITDYLLYTDFQLSPSGTALPTLLDTPVFLTPFNGQNFFYTDESGPSRNVSSNRPDINQDGVISIQGITAVLIPSISTLDSLQFPAGSSAAPAEAPSPSGPVDIPLSNKTNPAGLEATDGIGDNAGERTRPGFWGLLPFWSFLVVAIMVGQS